MLADDKVKAEKVDFPSNAVKIADTGSIERLKAYKGGLLLFKICRPSFAHLSFCRKRTDRA